MKTYGLVGYNIQNSPLPAIFKAAFEADPELAGKAEYRLFDIDPDKPETLANFCYESDLNQTAGFSLTSPYREVVMDYLDFFDPLAKYLGSVNTVKNETSNLNGYNTQGTGVIQALKEKTEVAGSRALVLGSNEVARAVIYGLKEFGAEVKLWSKDRIKAKKLSQDFDVNLTEPGEIAAAEFDIIINTMPDEAASENPLKASDIKKNSVLMDMIIRSAETELIKQAKEAEARVITGERPLLHEAAGQFEIWFSKTAPLEVMEKALYQEMSKSGI